MSASLLLWLQERGSSGTDYAEGWDPPDRTLFCWYYAEILADSDDKDLLVSLSGDLSEEVTLKKGDCIFAISLLPPSMDIQATSTISQCLAEAFKLNSEASAPLECTILDYLKEFECVFSKESFDSLPEPKQWAHAIKLIPDQKTSTCKVYLLAPSQTERAWSVSEREPRNGMNLSI